jgi:hypothetical protein
MEMEMQNVAMQMKQALDDKNMQIQQMAAQLDEYKKQIENTDKDKLFQLKKMELEHQFGIEDRILDAQLQQGEDADKAAIEAQRDLIKVKSEATTAAIKAESEQMDLDHKAESYRMDLENKELTNRINLASKIFGGNA